MGVKLQLGKIYEYKSGEIHLIFKVTGYFTNEKGVIDRTRCETVKDIGCDDAYWEEGRPFTMHRESFPNVKELKQSELVLLLLGDREHE